MSRGYWNIILAAIGLVLSGPSDGKEAQPNKTQSSNHSAKELGRIASAIEKIPPAQAPDRGCHPPQEDRQSDLCAQWKAADAAAESARWDLWSLWLAGGGLLVGLGTLVAAICAAKFAKDAATHTETGAVEARRAADAAETALTQTREVSYSELRPYLAITRVYIHKSTPNVVWAEIQNSGQTPAYGVHIRTHRHSGATPHFTDINFGMIGPSTIRHHAFDLRHVQRGFKGNFPVVAFDLSYRSNFHSGRFVQMTQCYRFDERMQPSGSEWLLFIDGNSPDETHEE